jgi:hypothetical protein
MWTNITPWGIVNVIAIQTRVREQSQLEMRKRIEQPIPSNKIHIPPIKTENKNSNNETLSSAYDSLIEEVLDGRTDSERDDTEGHVLQACRGKRQHESVVPRKLKRFRQIGLRFLQI